MAAQAPMNHQGFRDVARRRLKEAEHILELANHRYFDGAVTYALLSAECALKALILFDQGVQSKNDLDEDIQASAFRSKSGHDLSNLYSKLSSRITTQVTRDVSTAIRGLHGKDPYQHRYGALRPNREHARPIIDEARTLLNFMIRLTI